MPSTPKSFSFEQIKPNLADANPETTVAAWFKVTHPNVPLPNDNFKSDESLDSYLGLVDDPSSRSEDTAFLLNRPMNQRLNANCMSHMLKRHRATNVSHGFSGPTAFPTLNARPLSAKSKNVRSLEAKAKNIHSGHPNSLYQKQTGYLYPGKRDERKRPRRECNVQSFQLPRPNLTSKNPQTTPTASPNKECSVSSNGWVTYTYEYDREPNTKKAPQRTPTSVSNGWVTYDYESENYSRRLAANQKRAEQLWYYQKKLHRAHSERVSLSYKRDPALYYL